MSLSGNKNWVMKCMPIVIIMFVAMSCSDILDQQPTDRLSTGTFWQTESDAMLGLSGVYSYNSFRSWRNWRGPIFLGGVTDNGIRTTVTATLQLFSDELIPTDNTVGAFWSSSYQQIAKCNRFLENIGRVDMDEDEKTQMIAEVRFLRAWTYFNLSQYWGSVPLVKKVLTQKQANSVSRVSKEEVVSFVDSELKDAATDLPWTRPSNELGRITKSAALAARGRLLLADSSWDEAAATYKEIIDSGANSIDPDYASLFNGTNEGSSSIIWASRFNNIDVTNELLYQTLPHLFKGHAYFQLYQNFIDSYYCTDGKPISESPLYDSDHEFENRDPRLYYNVFLPGYTTYNGQTFHSHPDSTSTEDAISGNNSQNTGYCLKKYAIPNFNGDITATGADIPIIRYAEVLLGYLEAKIKAGDPITQSLLDQTINKVRGRESVNMPPITVTDRDSLWTILKHERRDEFPFEGIHYWDLLRWREFGQVLNRTFYGIKLNPDEREGLPTDDEGHYKVFTMTFDESKDYQWPIPQHETDIDPNLEQYPEYR